MCNLDKLARKKGKNYRLFRQKTGENLQGAGLARLTNGEKTFIILLKIKCVMLCTFVWIHKKAEVE